MATRQPGEPPVEYQRTRWGLMLGLLLGAAALIGAWFLVLPRLFPPPSAEIYAAGYGLPSASELTMPAGAEVAFQVYAELVNCTNENKNEALLLHIELRQGDQVTSTKECTGIGPAQLTAGTRTETTFFGDSCDLTVPEPGADRIEITPRWKRDGKGADLQGLVFRVFVEGD